jgi:hypothetical protein
MTRHFNLAQRYPGADRRPGDPRDATLQPFESGRPSEALFWCRVRPRPNRIELTGFVIAITTGQNVSGQCHGR